MSKQDEYYGYAGQIADIDLTKSNKINGCYQYELKEYYGSKIIDEIIQKKYSISLPINELILIDKESDYFLSLYPLLIEKTCLKCKLDQLFYFSHIIYPNAIFSCFNCDHQISTLDLTNEIMQLLNFKIDKKWGTQL